MSKLTVESAHEIIRENLSTIYHLPAKYRYIRAYIGDEKSLRETLFRILNFFKDKNILIYRHKYVFFVDSKTLTYRVRKKSSGVATSSRHINLLCAIGLINKQYQSRHKAALIDVNRAFFEKYPAKRMGINVFSFRRYTEAELDRLEARARRLHDAGVTSGNMGYNMLVLNGCEDIANEVYPHHNKNAPAKKAYEFQQLATLIDMLIEGQGYATREQIRDNMLISDEELNMVLRIFRKQLNEIYQYKRPTKQQQQQWNLKDKKYIYVPR